MLIQVAQAGAVLFSNALEPVKTLTLSSLIPGIKSSLLYGESYLNHSTCG